MELTKEDQKYLKNLGLKLRAIRQKKEWTLEDCEEHGWPNWRHLQKIESGKNITILTLRRLSRLYRIPMTEILDQQ